MQIRRRGGGERGKLHLARCAASPLVVGRSRLFLRRGPPGPSSCAEKELIVEHRGGPRVAVDVLAGLEVEILLRLLGNRQELGQQGVDRLELIQLLVRGLLAAREIKPGKVALELTGQGGRSCRFEFRRGHH